MNLKWFLEDLKNPFRWFRSWWWVLVNGYPTRKLRVVAVTGTDGKTTTTNLIYEILKAAGCKVGLVSTVSARIGSDELDTGLHVTNPDAKQMQALFKKMVDENCEFAVVEVTSHRLAQMKTVGYNIEVAVLTNITHEHLDYHGTMKRYAAAKAKLFENAKYAILNQDDEFFEYFKNKSRGRVIAYAKSDVKDVSEALRGEYNKYNIAAALAVAEVLGIKYQVSSMVIKNFGGVLGRREEVKNDKGFKVYVDFAHTPNGLKSILMQLRSELPASAKASVGRRKLIVVFGCTGERDQTKRPIMGKIAADIADVVVVTSDDTRRESQDEIYKQIVSGIKYQVSSMEKIHKINDRREAIKFAIGMAKKGDIVLLAGKGHEKSINLGGVEHPWSDVEIARDIIMNA